MAIPRYDRKNRLHEATAQLCPRAERIAVTTVNKELEAKPGKGQIALSKAVRNALAEAGIDARINECVGQLLPDYV